MTRFIDDYKEKTTAAAGAANVSFPLPSIKPNEALYAEAIHVYCDSSTWYLVDTMLRNRAGTTLLKMGRIQAIKDTAWAKDVGEIGRPVLGEIESPFELLVRVITNASADKIRAYVRWRIEVEHA